MKRINLLVAVFFLIVQISGYTQDEVEQKETPPPGGEPKDFKLPEKNVVRFDNGLELVMVPYGIIPKATIQVMVKTGNIHEGENEVWLSDVVSDLLEEGSTNRTSNEIADDIAAMGGNLNIGVGQHTTNLSAAVLYEFTPDAILLIADVLMNPAFPESELDRLINDRKRQLEVALTTPQNIASQEFYATLYPDHPYGRLFPTSEMLDSYTLEKIKKYYADNYGAKRTIVYVAGKFNEEDVKNAVESSLGTWREGPEVDYPVAEPSTTDKISILDRAGAPQSTVMMGLPVLAPGDEDWVAMSVTNALLGGSFASRITMNIREDKGYTYSPFSAVTSRYKSAIWYEQADVTTKDTGPSLREITREIYKLQEEPPSEEELEGVQNYQAGIFVLQNSSPQGIINQMINIDVYGFEEDYLSTYVQKIYAVTPEKVQEITQKYIRPEEMAIILVGDKEKLDEQMKDFERSKEEY